MIGRKPLAVTRTALTDLRWSGPSCSWWQSLVRTNVGCADGSSERATATRSCCSPEHACSGTRVRPTRPRLVHGHWAPPASLSFPPSWQARGVRATPPLQTSLGLAQAIGIGAAKVNDDVRQLDGTVDGRQLPSDPDGVDEPRRGDQVAVVGTPADVDATRLSASIMRPGFAWFSAPRWLALVTMTPVRQRWLQRHNATQRRQSLRHERAARATGFSAKLGLRGAGSGRHRPGTAGTYDNGPG